MTSLSFALLLVFVAPACSGDTPSFAVAAECACDHEWIFDDGTTVSELYTATFYCFESPSEWDRWVAEEIAICSTEAYPESVQHSCACECTPTLAC